MKKTGLIALIACLLFGSTSLVAQKNLSDSLPQETIVRSTLRTYYSQLKENAPFYNGTEYPGHGMSSGGHAYFNTDTVVLGKFIYDGILFTDIGMRYDLVEDAIIIKDYTQNYFIRLNSAKILRFWLGKESFLRLNDLDTGKNKPAEGFYHILYEGNLLALEKNRKEQKYTTTSEKVLMTYQSLITFYVKKEQTWFEVESQKDLIRLFKDKKTLIRKFITENNLSMKKQPRQTISKVVAYYDTLNN